MIYRETESELCSPCDMIFAAALPPDCPSAKDRYSKELSNQTAGLTCDALTEPSPLPKLQALVYDILPSTTAVFSYAIGSRKLSAEEQFFVVGGGAQTAVSLLQTTQNKACHL